MKFYFNNSLIVDLLVCIAGGSIFLVFLPYLNLEVEIYDNQISLINTLITLGSTFLGFLLTVVTIIITFKSSYDNKKSTDEENSFQADGIAIFDRKVNKEKLFYGSSMHSFVVKIFMSAIIEIGVALGVLISLHFALNDDVLYYSLPLVFTLLLIVILSIIKSLYIFRLFLKVHS